MFPLRTPPVKMDSSSMELPNNVTGVPTPARPAVNNGGTALNALVAIHGTGRTMIANYLLVLHSITLLTVQTDSI